MISTHLPCKGLVHHSIVLPLKIGCLEFQLDDHSHPKTKVDNLKMMVSKKKESPLPGFHFQLNRVKLSWNLRPTHLKIVGKKMDDLESLRMGKWLEIPISIQLLMAGHEIPGWLNHLLPPGT